MSSVNISILFHFHIFLRIITYINPFLPFTMQSNTQKNDVAFLSRLLPVYAACIASCKMNMCKLFPYMYLVIYTHKKSLTKCSQLCEQAYLLNLVCWKIGAYIFFIILKKLKNFFSAYNYWMKYYVIVWCTQNLPRTALVALISIHFNRTHIFPLKLL